ncbi:hypothetical protein KsCSTR_11010 [Candidatus Kuenenia stuttgartiensis]|uniref:Uncharacterized protein n=1 Tax=Kuenenia stuttgartiensis TaxID=174633 RepID=A0A6G7GLI7_KUEST|nr:hypothetical protein KsCSTR_11010 [Candidatus Kuenenia stuttgartiensis]
MVKERVICEVASEKALAMTNWGLAMTKACHYKGTSVSLRGSFPKQSVYYEIFRDVRNAISRDKQIKGGSKGLKNRIN